jgi:iron complex outermembrane recepter protein
MTSRSSAAFVVAGILSVSVGSGITSAQDSPSSADVTSNASNSNLLEAVTVTAQRREQSIQDVGIAVSAVSGDQIQAFGLRDSIDIAKMASNVSTAGAWGGMQQQFTIRGVTQNDFSDDVESVVAVYVDDTYVSMLQGGLFGMFDLDRVEVLKGPQGTLFGRNATGGLANFITKRPTDSFEGYMFATYGSYNQARIEGAVSGPLNDKIRARLSGFFEKYDGWVKNNYPYQTDTGAPGAGYLGTDPSMHSNLGGVLGNWALRGQVVADLSDKVQLWTSTYYNHFVGGPAPYTGQSTVAVLNGAGQQINTLVASPNTVCQIIQAGTCVSSIYSGNTTGLRPRPGGDFFGFINPDTSGHSTSTDFAPDNASQFTTWGASAKLTADLGNITLTAISDYKNFAKNFVFDLDSRSFNQFIWSAFDTAHQFSQELRANGVNGPLTWIGGAYFLAIDNDFAYGISALPDCVFSVCSWDQPRIADLKTRSSSLFAQIEYALTDKLTFITGVRGSEEKKDYSFQILFVPENPAAFNTRNFVYSPAVNVPGYYQPHYLAHTSQPLFMWKTGLNYKLQPDVLLYADVSKGVKAGSFNSVPLATQDIPYKSEDLLAYEMGMKSTFFGGRARLNTAVFYYDYKNYQATRWVDVGNVIINADAHFYGAEEELAANITKSLEAMLNVGFQRNTVFNVPIGAGYRDVETTYAPHWTPSAMLRYAMPQTVAGGKVSLQVDGNYHSQAWGNLNNFSADRIPSYVITNAKLSWSSENGATNLSLFANNIFNKSDEIIRYDTSILFGGNLVAVGKPRWLGVDAKYKF